MSIQILDNSGATNGLKINASGEAAIAPTQDYDNAGIVAVACETNPDGVGSARKVLVLDASNDYRLRAGLDSTLWKDTYCHTVVNTSKYKVVNTTMTNALSGGRWVLNNAASVASSTAVVVNSYMHFPLNLSGTLYADFECGVLLAPVTNNVCEWGLFQAATYTAVSDGVLFRLDSDGVLKGVINSNSTESVVNLLSAPATPYPISANTIYHFLIAVHNDVTEFWINDVLTGEIQTGAALGSPMLAMSEPLTFRTYNAAATSVGQQLLMVATAVTRGDMDTMRLWPTVQVGMGNSCYNSPDGSTAGSTGSYVLSTAPVTVGAASQLSSTAAYSTLGGQFALASIASAETDVLVFNYLNPAGTPAIPGKNLIIRGVTINTVNLGAVGSAVGVVQQWSLGVGGTAVAMPADSATAGTRAYRRVPLGFTTFPASAAIGAPSSCGIDINMDSPIIVEPGTYLAVYMKPINGPVNTGQITRGICFINGYFE
jgi:hypothetical protein